ncbi:thioredoxin domain-containing protein [Novosphingobium sp. FSW06-99]|uniref:thioredoxin domain-containing protein n=1 Tax=Novosphingobium sp. FSW06-99 TaxID=1739113 RepID=UPI00076D1096|nr:thioredoxin domain-containing protein [Novosphingobium sp. FSW06-99]KUR80040.1 protein-disulfide isomerase [Novosphingobium sp. FSW06-99]
MKPIRLALALAVMPLALGLAACGKKADTPVVADTALAKVAPPAGKQWSDVITATPDGGYLMGNPDAPLKLVEYGALSCSHCAAFSTEGFPHLRDDYVNSGRVSYELRFFMLNMLDLPAVLLATCANTPDTVIPMAEQYWAWQPTMFANLKTAGQDALQKVQTLPASQRIPVIARLAGMNEFFAQRGIATAQGATCLSDATRASALSNATDKATKEFNVTGTPAFILNGRNLDVSNWDALEPILQKAGAR